MSPIKVFASVLFMAQLLNTTGCGVPPEGELERDSEALYLGCKDSEIVLTPDKSEAFRVAQAVKLEDHEPGDLQVLTRQGAKEVEQYNCDDFSKLRISTQKVGDSNEANADSLVRFPGEHEYPLFAPAYADGTKHEVILEYKSDLKDLEIESHELRASSRKEMHAKSYKNSGPRAGGEWYLTYYPASGGWMLRDNWGIECSPGDSTCANGSASQSASIYPGCFGFCRVYDATISQRYKYNRAWRTHSFRAKWTLWTTGNPGFSSGVCISNCDNVTP